MQKQEPVKKCTTLATRAAVLLAAITIGGCSGGSGGDGTPGTSGDFVVLRTTPANNGQLFLNESIAIDFSNKVDIDSADFNAMSFAVSDLNGKQLAEPVQGTFRLARATGDDEIGRRLEFLPRFPLKDTFDDGGFRPGRRYIVQLVKGDHRRNVGLLDQRGKGLAEAVSFSFETADGTTPSQLFKDTKVGGPRKVGFEVSPVDPATGLVELSELGQVATEIRLHFDQPLNPHSANVPFAIDLDPRRRSVNNRGRIFLEYNDPDAKDAWIPAAIELERNTLDGSTVVIRPFGVLPNNATIRAIVESNLEDMSGESNVNNAAYSRVFAEFRTDDSYEVGFDAVVENFVDQSLIDLTAAFSEPLAEIVPGAIRANFEFEGSRTNLDYRPTTQEVVLDTDFTQITPSNGQPINVANGIFTFRDVEIPNGVTVRGTGSNPMVWLVTGDFVVAGDLIVDGGQGQRVDTLNSANFPSAGGVGNCGGGNGGQASQLVNDRTFVAESGFGPGQVPNQGGAGGRINCANPSCRIGSGGGGGSFVTQGDPYYKAPASGTFVQPNGVGGFGCLSRTVRTLPGGNPGGIAFTDPRPDNDFWGSAVDIFRNIRIPGELSRPRGGQGGGGGGDFGLRCNTRDPNFAQDEKGGGGGAGGGVLIIKALGAVRVEESGHISAEGGHGGGGAWAGSSNYGGGGGGGSGGMIVIMAGRHIEIVAHGNTYAANDYNFAISADGGASLLDVYDANSGNVRDKYVPAPSANNINARPSGGLGGLGLIQLMAPPGLTLSEDDTNTILDNNIHIWDPSTKARKRGQDKMRFLGWRGQRNGAGQYVDDKGASVNLGSAEGDIRPSPLLMPAPFGTRSRVRSRWIDLGAAARRMTPLGGDRLPRGVGQSGPFNLGDTFGPRPEFAGVRTGDDTDPLAGYIRVRDGQPTGVEIDYPEVSGATNMPVATVSTGVAFRGRNDAIRITLQNANVELGKQENRYAHYLAKIEANVDIGEFRILGHDASTIYLSSESGSLEFRPGMQVSVMAKFFSVFTNDVEGFPQFFLGRAPGPQGVQIPRANLRIGFAFHQNPRIDPATNKAVGKRFPEDETKFFADWNNTAKLDELNKGGYRYVMYDILFNTQYEVDPAFPNSNSLGTDTPRPEIRRLVLPYRY